MKAGPNVTTQAGCLKPPYERSGRLKRQAQRVSYLTLLGRQVFSCSHCHVSLDSVEIGVWSMVGSASGGLQKKGVSQ